MGICFFTVLMKVFPFSLCRWRKVKSDRLFLFCEYAGQKVFFRKENMSHEKNGNVFYVYRFSDSTHRD